MRSTVENRRHRCPIIPMYISGIIWAIWRISEVKAEGVVSATVARCAQRGHKEAVLCWPGIGSLSRVGRGRGGGANTCPGHCATPHHAGTRYTLHAFHDLAATYTAHFKLFSVRKHERFSQEQGDSVRTHEDQRRPGWIEKHPRSRLTWQEPGQTDLQIFVCGNLNNCLKMVDWSMKRTEASRTFRLYQGNGDNSLWEFVSSIKTPAHEENIFSTRKPKGCQTSENIHGARRGFQDPERFLFTGWLFFSFLKFVSFVILPVVQQFESLLVVDLLFTACNTRSRPVLFVLP